MYTYVDADACKMGLVNRDGAPVKKTRRWHLWGPTARMLEVAGVDGGIASSATRQHHGARQAGARAAVRDAVHRGVHADRGLPGGRGDDQASGLLADDARGQSDGLPAGRPARSAARDGSSEPGRSGARSGGLVPAVWSLKTSFKASSTDSSSYMGNLAAGYV